MSVNVTLRDTSFSFTQILSSTVSRQKYFIERNEAKILWKGFYSAKLYPRVDGNDSN